MKKSSQSQTKSNIARTKKTLHIFSHFMGPTGLSYFLGVAFFRTLVRHRKVKVVFLSEAKILSSEFTSIVNIINFKRLKKNVDLYSAPWFGPQEHSDAEVTKSFHVDCGYIPGHISNGICYWIVVSPSHPPPPTHLVSLLLCLLKLSQDIKILFIMQVGVFDHGRSVPEISQIDCQEDFEPCG